MIKASELIVREDGAAYHLGLRPEEIAPNVIVVGDPGRVALVASFLDEVEAEHTTREFHSVLGRYGSKKILVVSSGISSDNIDILVNELDALANIDFAARQAKPEPVGLNIVRIGTCGGLTETVALGDFVLSRYAVGGDGLLNFYADSSRVRLGGAEVAFEEYAGWNPDFGRPYVVASSPELAGRFDGIAKAGITYCAGGFYAPQGRELRLRSAVEDWPERVAGFRFGGCELVNMEMEGAALVGLARLLGHRAVTLCVVVAHRRHAEVDIDYVGRIGELIKIVLERI